MVREPKTSKNLPHVGGRKLPSKGQKAPIAVLLLAVLSGFQISGVDVTVFLGDLAFLIMALVPVLSAIWRPDRLTRRLMKWYALVLLLVLTTTVLDLSNGLSGPLILKGALRNASFAAVILVTSWLSLKRGLIWAVVVYFILAVSRPIWSVIQNPSELQDFERFIKYEYGYALIFPLLLTLRMHHVIGGLLACSAGLYVYGVLDYRGAGLGLFLAGALAVFAAVVMRNSGHPNRLAFRMLALVILGIPVWASLIVTVGDDPDGRFERRRASDFGRVQTAQTAWQGFVDRPLQGWGNGQHGKHFGLHDVQNPEVPVGVHNIPLQLAFEYGLTGALIGFAMSGLFVVGFARILFTVRNGLGAYWVILLALSDGLFQLLLAPLSNWTRILVAASLSIALTARAPSVVLLEGFDAYKERRVSRLRKPTNVLAQSLMAIALKDPKDGKALGVLVES